MTQAILQPYRRFEASFLNQLIQGGNCYVVSQSYPRANSETDHTKKPVLFTPYKEMSEGWKHYQHLKEKQDNCAALVDIRTRKVSSKIINMCNGNADKQPYLAVVGNMQYINNYIDRHYRKKIRSWVRRYKTDWNIREHNAVDPHFETVMGEPMVRISYGKQFVMISLEELEKL